MPRVDVDAKNKNVVCRQQLRVARDGELTILHWLATNGCVKGLQLCLDAGARPDGVDDEGRTACEWARDEGHAEVVRLLERRA